MSASNVLSFMKENDVKFVDLRFTDTTKISLKTAKCLTALQSPVGKVLMIPT